MTNPTKRHLVSLAALALAAVACDPFPAAPGGSPRVVRVITQNQATTGHSWSFENAGAAGAVTTDYAYLDDAIYIQFNKPMDGLSIQKYPDYNPDGTPITLPTGVTTACVPADGVTLSANFPANTTVCYVPNSVTDGGYMVVTPGGVLVYGETYTVGGTVKDYQGGALALDVKVTVDPRPQPAASGGYAMFVDWFDSGADSYTVEVAADVDGTEPTTGWAVANQFDGVASNTPAQGLLPADFCADGLCEILQIELVPKKGYWYRVKETTGGVESTRKATQDPGHTGDPLLVTLGTETTQATPADPPVITPGKIRVIWTRVRGATGYVVERAPNVDGSKPAEATWVVQAGTITSSGTTRTYADAGLTSGTRYWYRVTPTYASGFVAVKGQAVSRLAP